MIINGNEIKEKVLDDVRSLAQGTAKRVCFVQFGSDEASAAFIKMKLRVADGLGIQADVIHKDPADTAEALLLMGEIIEKNYDGIVVQLPLPQHLDTDLIIDSIPTEMDIDILSEDAKAHYRAATTERVAPVAGAVQEILWENKIILIGKKIAVLGRGKLVGEPIIMLLDRQELPYTVIDITTPEEEKIKSIQEADVV
ncbi:MAG TPA: tetrahydrofolate dehydrogenase/cyclohydrolase catalytic domain-containing protein, partial [Candidatus Paceibacterota bacterium]|nr:tetrahydrofolate dehydrogenase/cyclohydrolase catalytic domain-containing protein [Candidatus Paceibacterota bacterium]